MSAPAPVTQGVSLRQVDLPPKVVRTDAIQSFVTQETIPLTVHVSEGLSGTGYAHTIGTGGSSVIAPSQPGLGIKWDWQAIEARQSVFLEFKK